MSGGWSPVVHLACHKGAKPLWDDELAGFLPPASAPGLTGGRRRRRCITCRECLKDGSAGRRARRRAGRRIGEADRSCPPARDDDEPYAIRRSGT